MADVTAALGFRKLQATSFATNTAFFYFATLHDGDGSALATTTDAYAATGLGELATGAGYTAGGKTCGTASVVADTNVDCPNVVWTATGGSLGPVSYIAYWCNSSNTITGAKLVAVKDMSATPQTSTVGQAMTGTITNLIAF